MRPHFRFEDLEIWQIARSLAVKFQKLADDLEKSDCIVTPNNLEVLVYR